MGNCKKTANKLNAVSKSGVIKFPYMYGETHAELKKKCAQHNQVQN